MADLEVAIAALRRAEVIAVATDTVYGLVCDPDNAAAVDKIYELKERPASLELTLLAAAAADVETLVTWTATGRALAAQFWPGPLSLVLPVGPRRLAVPRAGRTLSVRVPDAGELLDLLRITGPLASTSANRHGRPAATSASAVAAAFGDSVPIVLGDGRPGGVASTIIDCSVSPPRVLRQGPIDSRTLRVHLRG